jgi:hypothetical protein
VIEAGRHSGKTDILNIYTQRMAELNWGTAIQYIREFRDPILLNLYEEAAEVQEIATEIYEKHNRNKKDPKVPELTIKVIHDFAFNNAVPWHEDWKEIGDKLVTAYSAIQAISATSLPAWWKELIGYTPPVR